MNLIRLALGWLVGIALAGIVALPLHWFALAAGAAGVSVVVVHRRWRWAALTAMCLALGGMRYHVAQPLLGPHHIERLAGTDEVILVGSVAEEPRRDDTGQQVVISVSHAGPDGRLAPAEGRVLVRTPPYPPYYPGDRLQISG
ncbi:MAG: DUF4131 domain-containing protein, partial [Chloroflexus sp.]